MIKEKNSKLSTSSNVVAGLNEVSTPLEEFAKKVFDKLIEEGVPPIPYYYKIYFFNLLDEEPESFRKQVYEYISLEETNELEKDLEIEKKLKRSFKYSKELLQHTAILYKNSQAIKEIFNKYKNETAYVANPKLFEKLLQSFEERLGKMHEKLEKELSQIKRLYSKNVEILKDIESNSFFDSRYGIYNKNFFLREVKKETKLIEKFKHNSSVVLLKITDEIINALKSEKSKILLNRSVAKIMLKTSRRTDIVAHLGDGVFGMLLKHTDRIGACRTVERLSDIITNSAIFLEGEEITIQIVSGIVEIKIEDEVDSILQHALEMMQKAEKDGVLYYVYEGN
ncbi:MAG: diguanylate cyclase [Nautiliaceae bacterium]|jgi:diguanylate cyclase (GGDEF)-like protein